MVGISILNAYFLVLIVSWLLIWRKSKSTIFEVCETIKQNNVKQGLNESIIYETNSFRVPKFLQNIDKSHFQWQQ